MENNMTPDPLAPFEQKLTNEYGLAIARMIGGDWFGSKGMIDTSCNFMSRRNYVMQKRLFARGEQDLKAYKDLMKKNDCDLEFLNLDWTIINVVQKFSRIVSNGMSDDNYTLDIRAIDDIALKDKQTKIKYHLTNMYAKDMLENAKNVLGIDMTEKGFVPEDEQELSLYMEIKERPKIEIAEELLINYVKKTNDWKFIENQKNVDLVNIGMTGVRVYIDKNDGVKIQYVDPEYYIHSPVNRNDFSDKYYDGYVDTITMSDLKRESGFDENTLRKIAGYYPSSKYKDTDFMQCDFNQLLDYRIDILRFAYKTSKKIVYKVKKRKGKPIKISLKSEKFVAPNREDVAEASKTLDTWLDGTYIIGTEYIYDYKESENISRDIMNKAMSPFVMYATDIYKNQLRSFLTDIEPIANQMQQIQLKMQNLFSELKPDLTEIDLNMLAELDDGKGGSREQWKTALSLLNIKGIVFTKRADFGEAGIKDKAAARPQAIQQGSALGVLLNLWAHYYNLIRDITGVNPAADGSMRSDTLVGVNEMAQLASNTATKHIANAAVELNRKIYELVSSRLNLIFKFKAHDIINVYENVIGREMLDAVQVLANRHLHEFGFLFELAPSEKQMLELREDLNIALGEQTIDVEVKIEAQRLAKSNYKLATQYLIYQRKKRIKLKQREQMMFAKDKSQNDAAAAQAKVQADTQAYQIKKQADLEYEKQMKDLRLQEAQSLIEINKPKVQTDFENDVYLRKLEVENKFQNLDYLENRKDQRTEKQASQQSKMIEQRKKDSSPHDFENEPMFEDLLQ